MNIYDDLWLGGRMHDSFCTCFEGKELEVSVKSKKML